MALEFMLNLTNGFDVQNGVIIKMAATLVKMASTIMRSPECEDNMGLMF